jgi:hypothetical protein
MFDEVLIKHKEFGLCKGFIVSINLKGIKVKLHDDSLYFAKWKKVMSLHKANK